MTNLQKDICVQVASLAEADRWARALRLLGADVETDRSIAERIHVVVCHFGATRVLIKVRGTIATGAEFTAMACQLLMDQPGPPTDETKPTT